MFSNMVKNKLLYLAFMNEKFYDFPFYKWEKEKANEPFLRQPFGELLLFQKNFV